MLSVDGHFKVIIAISVLGTGRDLCLGIPLTIQVIVQVQLQAAADNEDQAHIAIGIGQAVNLIVQSQLGSGAHRSALSGHIIDLYIISKGTFHTFPLVLTAEFLRIETVSGNIDICRTLQGVQTQNMIPAGYGSTAGSKLCLVRIGDHALFVKFQHHTLGGNGIDLGRYLHALGAQGLLTSIHRKRNVDITQVISFTGGRLARGVVLPVNIPINRLRLKGRCYKQVRNIAVQSHNTVHLRAYADLTGQANQQANAAYTVDLGLVIDFQLQGKSPSAGYVVADQQVVLYFHNIILVYRKTQRKIFQAGNFRYHIVFIHPQTYKHLRVDIVYHFFAFHKEVHLLTAHSHADTVILVGFDTGRGLIGGIPIFILVHIPVDLYGLCAGFVQSQYIKDKYSHCC